MLFVKLKNKLALSCNHRLRFADYHRQGATYYATVFQQVVYLSPEEYKPLFLGFVDTDIINDIKTLVS